MDDRSISTRWRIAAPIAAAVALAGRRFGAAAQDANPAPSAADGAFASMLALVPAALDGGPDNPMIASFADAALQLAATGVARPASVEDEAGMKGWMRATYPLAFASVFATNALLLGRDLLGYDATDLDQTLEVGAPPEVVTVLRGRFDHDAVAASWKANGYQMVDADGTQVASLHAEPEMDLKNPVSRLVLSRMNNAAFLADDTLVYTASLAAMRTVLAGGASLANRVDIAALLAASDTELASAILFSGSSVALAAQLPPALDPTVTADLLATTVAAAAEMPPVAIGLIGITPGGPLPVREGTPEPAGPEAQVVIRLLLVQPGSAEQAARAIQARLAGYRSVATNQPLLDRFAAWEVRPLAAANAVEVALTPGDRGPLGIWMNLFLQRDLLFLAW